MFNINQRNLKLKVWAASGIAALTFIFFGHAPVSAADVNITSSTSWTAGSYSYGNVTVSNNSQLILGSSTYAGDTNYSDDYGVTINATNVTVASGSSISADNQGYAGGYGSIWWGGVTYAEGPCPGSSGGQYTAGGGGHGGSGGLMSCTYGSATNPITLGSGGGQCNTLAGAPGGGAIIMVLTGTLTNNGTISANGGAGVVGAINTGGGAGGSVNITVPSLINTGAIQANGGNTGGGYSIGGGGGGGGRLHFNVTSWSNTGTLSAAGGTNSYSSSYNGSNGTIDGAVYSAINSPANGAMLNSLTSVSGTAVDYTGGTLQYVDISIQRASDSMYSLGPGSGWTSTQTWLRATGTSAWSYAVNNNIGSGLSTNITIKSRVTTSALVETPGNGITFYYDNTAPVISSVTLTP